MADLTRSLPDYTAADMAYLRTLQCTDGVRLEEAPSGVAGWRCKRTGKTMVLRATRRFMLTNVVLREVPPFYFLDEEKVCLHSTHCVLVLTAACTDQPRKQNYSVADRSDC
jgi:hypothetical protein